MPIEAMVDLTGGLAERYELKNSRYRQKRRGEGRFASTQVVDGVD
jgi:hypothetical protein